MNKIAVSIRDKFNSPWGKGTGGGLADLVSVILSNAIVVASVLMFLLMLGGGIAVIAGAGRDDPEATAKGKQAVTAAVIGFIIIFAVYWIAIIIDVITGVPILMPPEP